MYWGGVEGKVKKGTPAVCIRQGKVLRLCDICQERREGRMEGLLPGACWTWVGGGCWWMRGWGWGRWG